jgi:hypothetical protein
VIPSERSLVDLSESKTTTLIGIGDVSVVIVKVVEGSVASTGLVNHSRHVDRLNKDREVLYSTSSVDQTKKG